MNPIKMTKTAEGMVVSTATAEHVPPAEVKATTQMVRGAGGSVAVAQVEDETEVAEHPETLVMQSTGNRMVAAMTVEPPAEVEMQEVAWNDVKQKMVEITTEARSAIDKLINQPRAETERRLTKMLKAGKIGSFRVLVPGESFSQDLILDRVQVFTDKDNFVQSVQVG